MGTDGLHHADLTEAIIGAAMRVLNTLKPGLRGKACENALVIELRELGYRVDQQIRYDLTYRAIVVDTLVPDLVVNESVIVDPKVTEDFVPAHFAQMLGYPSITQLRVALLLNFKHASLRWKRFIRQVLSVPIREIRG